jgi:hypothetical protein
LKGCRRETQQERHRAVGTKMWAAGWLVLADQTGWVDRRGGWTKPSTCLAVGRAGRTGGSPGGLGRGNESDGLKGRGMGLDGQASRLECAVERSGGPLPHYPCKCPLRKAVQPASLLRPSDRQAPSSKTASSMHCCAAAMQRSAPFGDRASPASPAWASVNRKQPNAPRKPAASCWRALGVAWSPEMYRKLLMDALCRGPQPLHRSRDPALAIHSTSLFDES